MHLADEVLDLGTIGPDVLYCRRAHIARDEREVLGAVEAVAQAEVHDVVPRLAAAAGDAGSADVAALDGRVDHNAGIVAREQEIAAATDDDKGLCRLPQDGSHLEGFVRVGILQESVATGINAKGVVTLETVVAKVDDRHVSWGGY